MAGGDSLMDIFGINRRISDIQRLREIVNVLIRHGFGHLVERLRLDETLPFGKQIFRRIESGDGTFPGYDRIRSALEELGPTFIKFGQILSLRTDIVPPELAVELESLQDRVAPMKWDELMEALDPEVKQMMEEHVSDVKETPMASASLAQVHEARLKTGEDVILKIRRPNIAEKVDRDINLMEFLAQMAERYLEDARRFHPQGLVDEFATTIRDELNFSNEAINIHRFHENFREEPDVRIPVVHWDLTGEKLLTLERIDGRPVSAYFDDEHVPPVSREELARRGAEIVFKQVFEHGFFHGDPHPGNILITPQGKIAFVDFGMVGRFDQELMDEFAHILMAIDRRDSHEIMKVLIRLEILSPRAEGVDVRRHILRLIDKYYEIPLQQISSREIFRDLNRFLTRFDIRFPPEFYMLLKAVLTVESVGERLDPDFEIAETARPYLHRLIRRQRGPERLIELAPNIAFDFLRFLRDFPSDIYDFFRQLRAGSLHFEFEHQGLDDLVAELQRDSNRLSLAMILSSLIIGSSLIISSGQGPTLWGYPVFGLSGFLIAGFLGLALVITIFRSGRF